MKLDSRLTRFAAFALLALAAALLFNTPSRAAPPAPRAADSDRRTPAPEAGTPVTAAATAEASAAAGAGAHAAPDTRREQAWHVAPPEAAERTYPTTAARTNGPPDDVGGLGATHGDGHGTDALAGGDDGPAAGHDLGRPLRC